MQVLNKIKFGVFLPFYAFRKSPSFSLLQNVVSECEQLGYYSVWLDDHLMLKKTPILECWTTLSALSSVTEKIKLGTMVTCNSFRNPSLLAKMASTLDNISNGRLELGVGAGVQEEEHIAYGFPFPLSKIRVERLKEAVEIVKKLWTEKVASYSGKHYTIKEASCEPKPLQKPHPPITIGGGGEKLTLKVTAQHADRYDWGYLPLEQYRHKLKALEKHCIAVGRNFQEIEKSCWPAGQIFIGADRKEVEERVMQWIPKGVSQEDFTRTNLVGTPEDCLKQIRQYAELGVTYFMLFFGDLPGLTGLRLFSEVVRKMT
jgi:F420-dependent oxidoreductase-like protein